VLTFTELREMLGLRRIEPAAVEPRPFDPPHGSLGSLFPLARGLLQAADLPEDLLTGEIIAADGNPTFVEAIDDFEMGESEVRLLDILTCEGCIGGIGFSRKEPLHRRRAQVSRRSKRQVDTFDEGRWERDMERYGRLDLSRGYTAGDQRFKVEPTDEEVREIFVRMNKFTPEDELNCGACGYDTCRAHAVACYQGIAEIEMCLPYVIEKLSTTVDDLEDSNRSLETTKEALIKTEKLASMGQLAAGIAHEVNNPLGIIMLQANILLEECEKGSEMGEDLELIVDQANRCKRIISGLLNFARQSRVLRQPKSMSDLVGQTLRTVPMEPNVKITVDDRLADPVAEVDSDQIVQVLVNLITNAQQAMPDGGELRILLSDDEDEVTVAVSDTGVGIPPENIEKLWDPFFTTKQVGKGTGLGLAVTHGIVKMHRGQCMVESNADAAAGPTGTTFRITLPRHEL
jgi:C4-dicarboxylate-specific signal transduction histidine kinase